MIPSPHMSVWLQNLSASVLTNQTVPTSKYLQFILIKYNTIVELLCKCLTVQQWCLYIADKMIVEMKTKKVDFEKGNIKFEIIHFFVKSSITALCVCLIDCVHCEGNSEKK